MNIKQTDGFPPLAPGLFISQREYISATPAGTEGQQCPQGSVTGPLQKYVQSVNSLELLCPTGSRRAAKTELAIGTRSPQSVPIPMSWPPWARRFDLPRCHGFTRLPAGAKILIEAFRWKPLRLGTSWLAQSPAGH